MLLELSGSDGNNDKSMNAIAEATSNRASDAVTRVMEEACDYMESSMDESMVPLLIGGSNLRLEPLHLHSLPWGAESDPEWVRIKTVMDSGAAGSVALRIWLRAYRLKSGLDQREDNIISPQVKRGSYT